MFMGVWVKKIKIVNLFIIISSIVVLIYLLFSILLTPYALNESRQLLGKDNLNSFLPTIRTKQFSDSFKGFTYIVEKKETMKLKIFYMTMVIILKILLPQKVIY